MREDSLRHSSRYGLSKKSQVLVEDCRTRRDQLQNASQSDRCNMQRDFEVQLGVRTDSTTSGFNNAFLQIGRNANKQTNTHTVCACWCIMESFLLRLSLFCCHLQNYFCFVLACLSSNLFEFMLNHCSLSSASLEKALASCFARTNACTWPYFRKASHSRSLFNC